MKITQLAAKPKLIKIKLSNKDLVKRYNEEIEFHTWDRQPIDTFMELANVNSDEGKPGDIVHLVKDLILINQINLKTSPLQLQWHIYQKVNTMDLLEESFL